MEALMADNVGSKVSYFLVGLGVGADEGKDYAQRKARELRERADELIERSKDVASRKKDSFSAAVDAGRDAYLREASKS
jgi:hypothetical protein